MTRNFDDTSALDVLRDLILDGRHSFGCGSHSCLFERVRGMGTNGHCQCLEGLRGDARQRVLQLAKLYRAVRDEVDKP